MRTPEAFVNDLLEKKRTPFDILAISRVVRKGAWLEEVQKILFDRNLLTEAMMEEVRQKITQQSKKKWETQKQAIIARQKIDEETRQQREKMKEERTAKLLAEASVKPKEPLTEQQIESHVKRIDEQIKRTEAAQKASVNSKQIFKAQQEKPSDPAPKKAPKKENKILD